MAFMQRLWKNSFVVPVVLSVGGFTTIYIAYRSQTRQEVALYQEVYVQKAVELFLKNDPAVEIVGLPIDFKAINLKNKFNSIGELNAKVVLPIVGSKLNGEIFVWATKTRRDQPKVHVTDSELEDAKRMKPKEREKWIIEKFGSRVTKEEREYKRAWRVTRLEAKFGTYQEKRFLIYDEATDAPVAPEDPVDQTKPDR